MPSQVLSTVENTFTKGLVTEFTGLNFPEDAAIDCDNCTFDLIGDVFRRQGITFEENYSLITNPAAGKAINTYKWNNVAGQGEVQYLVTQVGSNLNFWDITGSTDASPLSGHKFGPSVDLSSFAVSSFDSTLEAQFADGNGYLFVFHPSCDPIYVEYASNTFTPTAINVRIRDFTGVNDGLAVNTRPESLSSVHQYNLSNQGWTAGNAWLATNTDPNAFFSITVGSPLVLTVASGIVGVTPGEAVTISGAVVGHGTIQTVGAGNVTSYAGTTLTINITSVVYPGTSIHSVSTVPNNIGYIDDWHTAVGLYPSNADVWWYFKNPSNVFDPATTIDNVTLNTGNAPRGHYILNAFNQQRSSISTLAGINDITTTARPRLGTWFQGRVWYTGVDGYQASTNTTGAYAWTESIYFSQIITDGTQFGNCFQTNDPTSETLFDLLPTDGGVIYIQGSGSIYKLFPVQNGMLVFASNGVWFITGSQGIGFSANDYTITKISAVQSISSCSFVDVNGMPYFWNEEGIYSVQPTQGGALQVAPITYNTIWTFYKDIPKFGKLVARGVFNPIHYTIQWLYNTNTSTDTTSRYTFDKALSYNVINKAFFPYTMDATVARITGLNYINAPGFLGATPGIKYFAAQGTTVSFADEHDEAYVDWGSVNYESFFVTGYRVHGQAQRRFQMPYIYIFSNNPDGGTSYKIQGLWDYATSGSTGRWSTAQLIEILEPNYDVVFRRHRIRGNGLVLQIKVKSVDGKPFDMIGWSSYETANQGV